MKKIRLPLSLKFSLWLLLHLGLLGGAVIVETVFAWPGVGQLALQSITGRDFLVAQAVVLLASISYVALNFCADLLYSAVDPRIRLGGANE